MKKSILFLLLPAALCAAIACHKSSGPSTSNTGTRLNGVRGYSGGIVFRSDTFMYNGSGQLLAQRQWSYTNGQSDNDTVTVSFAYPASGSDPTAYTVTDGFGSNTYSLTYDNQGRLSKDTLSPDISNRSSFFTYPGKNVVFTSVTNTATDTFYVGSDSNVFNIIHSAIPYSSSQYTVTSFTYTPPYANPFHSVGQTANMRILLTKIDALELFANDFISKDIYTFGQDGAGYSITLTFTTTPSGLVISGTGAGASLNFSYQ